MLIVYDYQDLNGSSDTRWLEEPIVRITHVRSQAFDDPSMREYVSQTDGETDGASGTGNAKYMFRHYIPYSRIYAAINDHIVLNGLTRRDLYEWLMNACTELGIVPDQFLENIQDDPLEKRVAYDTWVDWGVNAICQYNDNIFYGPGTGDGGGKKVDEPTGSKAGVQTTRLAKGAMKLKKVLTNLEIN